MSVETTATRTAETDGAADRHGPDWTRVGAGLLALGVALAAFAAHGLEKMVEPDLVSPFDTGVRQHMWHALGLMVLGRLDAPPRATGWLVLLGIVLFSGSLYVLSLSGQRWLGAVTPLGGLSFMAGWSILAIKGWKRAPEGP
ncbi:MAG: DUF423 domain-containing protein [Alphaproteobacteria bacterium]|nr:DUF423 domain-containing protein [Alphaproteobacteria bacterium]